MIMMAKNVDEYEIMKAPRFVRINRANVLFYPNLLTATGRRYRRICISCIAIFFLYVIALFIMLKMLDQS